MEKREGKKRRQRDSQGFAGSFPEASPARTFTKSQDETTHIRRPGGESTGDNKTYPLRKLQSIQKSAPKGRGRRRRRIS
jgi:hypothetical protein